MERNKNFIVGVYSDPDEVVSAVKKIRSNKIKVHEVYSPFAIHGIDEALGYKRSRLPIAAFLFGMTGTLLALTMQFWMMGIDWPMIIGGKNFAALPPFIPVTFELTVLISALGMVGVFMVASDGSAKRVKSKDFPTQGRYGQGVVAWKLPPKVLVVGMAVEKGTSRATLHLKKLLPKTIRIDDAPLQSRVARGKSIQKLKAGDRATSLTVPRKPPRLQSKKRKR